MAGMDASGTVVATDVSIVVAAEVTPCMTAGMTSAALPCLAGSRRRARAVVRRKSPLDTRSSRPGIQSLNGSGHAPTHNRPRAHACNGTTSTYLEPRAGRGSETRTEGRALEADLRERCDGVAVPVRQSPPHSRGGGTRLDEGDARGGGVETGVACGGDGGWRG